MVERATTIRDGLVIETVWDENHVGPIELHVTLETLKGDTGITDRAVRALSLQPPRTPGDPNAVGEWIERNRNRHCGIRPQNPNLFYSHVALLYILAIQEGARSPLGFMATYANIRARMAHEWVMTARKRGLLTQSIPDAGKAHGRLTTKAKDILRSQSTIWRERDHAMEDDATCSHTHPRDVHPSQRDTRDPRES